MARKSWWWALGVLLLVSTVPYSRALDYGLINLDDYAYITISPCLRDLLSIQAWEFFLTDVSQGIWMPLTYLSYGIDHALFGEWFGGFHLHSILVHGVNSVLVWLLLMELFGDRNGRTALLCLAGAVVWAVHPLRCESVVFLASRKDVLSLFWELLALICWVRGSKAEDGLQESYTVGSLAFFAIGAMCKPSVMTFPALCLIVDAFIIRRVNLGRYVRPFAMALILAVFAKWQQGMGGATQLGAGESIPMRLADGVAAFGVYLTNTVLPTDLALQCVKRWPEMPRGLFAGAVLSVLCLGFVGWRTLRIVRCFRGTADVPMRGRESVAAGLLWFSVAVFPMLGFVPFGYHAFADRFTYIPAIGLSIVLVALLAKVAEGAKPTRVCLFAMAAVCLALGVLTWRQTGFWKDDGSAFGHALEVDGDRNAIAHLSLGKWYFECRHDLGKSIRHFGRGYELQPTWIGDSYIFYIFALNEAGQHEKARRMLDACSDEIKELVKGRSEEEQRAFWHPEGEVSDDLSRIRALFDFGQVSCWIVNDAERGLAVRWLKEKRDRYDDNPMYQYLKLQLAERTGDRRAADDSREFLSKRRPLQGYVNFRWFWGSEGP